MIEDTKATWKIFHPDCQKVPQYSANFTEFKTLVEFQSQLSVFAHRYRLKAVEAGRKINNEIVLGVGTWQNEKWLFIEYEGVLRYDWPDSWQDEG